MILMGEYVPILALTTIISISLPRKQLKKKKQWFGVECWLERAGDTETRDFFFLRKHGLILFKKRSLISGPGSL